MTKNENSEFERPILTVDVVLLTIRDRQLRVVLNTRSAEPFKGKEALIGGFIHVEEDRDADSSAARVLDTKAGLKDVYAEQLMTFSGAQRDPRGWSASIAYLALVHSDRIDASELSSELAERPVDETRGLPFDHDEILNAGLRRLRGKGAYSTMPTQLLADLFSLGELQEVYEIVMGTRLDQSSFRRKMYELDLIEETDQQLTGPRRRPAKLYRLKSGVTTFDGKTFNPR